MIFQIIDDKTDCTGVFTNGKIEHRKRVKNMIFRMDEEGFGSCTNTGACEVVCPKEISTDNIVKLNKSYIKTILST